MFKQKRTSTDYYVKMVHPAGFQPELTITVGSGARCSFTRLGMGF